MSAAEQ